MQWHTSADNDTRLFAPGKATHLQCGLRAPTPREARLCHILPRMAFSGGCLRRASIDVVPTCKNIEMAEGTQNRRSRIAKTGGLMPYANSDDERAYQRLHYERNKELYKKRAVASRAQQRREQRLLIRRYLESHPCVDCGNPDIRVLQFDHIERGPDVRRISSLIGTRNQLLAELEKCEVRCANCHMIRTGEQLNWKTRT